MVSGLSFSIERYILSSLHAPRPLSGPFRFARLLIRMALPPSKILWICDKVVHASPHFFDFGVEAEVVGDVIGRKNTVLE